MCEDYTGFQSCQCYGVYEYRLLNDIYFEINSLYYDIDNEHGDSELAFYKTHQVSGELIDIYSREMMPLLDSIRRYKERNVLSKHDLSKHDLLELYYDIYEESIHNFYATTDKFNKAYQALYSSLRTIRFDLLEMHNILFRNKLDIITKDNYNSTTLGRMMLDHVATAKYPYLYGNLSSHFEVSYLQLISLHLFDTITIVSNIFTQISHPLYNLQSSMDRFNDVLLNFKQFIKMDTNFYM